MRYIPIRGTFLVVLTGLSALLGAIPLILAALLWGSKELALEYAPFLGEASIPWSLTLYTLLGLSLPLSIAPLSYVLWNNMRYSDALLRQVPTFFKGAADGVRAGMTLERALTVSAESVGDPLKTEISLVVAHTSLGVPFEEALQRLTWRVPDPTMKKVASLLAVAQVSGGRVADVLETAAEMYGMLRGYEDERRARMAPYVWVTYIALAVFLLTATIITAVFVQPLQTAGIPGLFTPPPPQLFKALFFISSYLQAFFGGLVSGKVGRGTVKAGLTHSLVLILITIAYFNLQEIVLAPMLTPRF
ncbi:MAG: type II secretion system F family protein [Infirmifilum sp.]